LRKRLIRKTPRRRTGHGWQAAVEKKIGENYPRYERELKNLLDAGVTGDPEKPLRHASKSADNLSAALRAQGIQASPRTGEENAQTAGISDAGEPEGQKRQGRPS
jgi:hypothetical protein